MKNEKNKNTAEVLIECLENHGVSHIFGVPGEETLALLEAIRKSKITFITTRHESAAAFMAATIGRVTGKLGVALSTLGPGATNFLTGAAYAQLGGFPLMLITGQKPIRKSKQGKFQIVDIVAMMKSVTKFSVSITSPEQVTKVVEEAIRLAETERSGAVHIELPEDIADEACDAIPLAQNKTGYIVASGEAISGAIKEIENAKHPIVILGGAVNRLPLGKELGKFFEKTGIPFVSTQMGKGGFDETSPLYIGTTAIASGDFVHQALSKADAMILIGHDVTNTPPMILTGETVPGVKVIHVNSFFSSAKDVYIPTSEVIGEIANTLKEFAKQIKVNSNWDFSYFFKVRDESQKEFAKFSQSVDFPLRPESIIANIQKIFPSNGILALDNGMYKIYIGRDFITKDRNGLLLDNALATMGAGLPSGMALKLLYPNRKVIVVAGDGGIMMSLGDLETAVRLGINLVVLILDDSGFGMISWKQRKVGLADFGLSFKNPDFVALAKSFGATGYKVEKAEDLSVMLEKALNGSGVHIVHCPISYEEANKILGASKVV